MVSASKVRPAGRIGGRKGNGEIIIADDHKREAGRRSQLPHHLSFQYADYEKLLAGVNRLSQRDKASEAILGRTYEGSG